MIPKNYTRDTLHARGLRLTEPRRMILEAVRGCDVHPSAAFVYRRVRRHLPHVSLGTVYRNLRLLAAHGLLTERPDPGGMRFDGNLTAHDHFTCVECGRIFDVPPRGAPGVRRPVSVGTGFEILDHRIEFYGRCAACRPRRGSTSRRPRRRGTKEEVWQARVSRAPGVRRT